MFLRVSVLSRKTLSAPSIYALALKDFTTFIVAFLVTFVTYWGHVWPWIDLHQTYQLFKWSQIQMYFTLILRVWYGISLCSFLSCKMSYWTLNSKHEHSKLRLGPSCACILSELIHSFSEDIKVCCLYEGF